MSSHLRPSIKQAFMAAGFANTSLGELRLLPCSPGTFFKLGIPACLECPAGESLIRARFLIRTGDFENHFILKISDKKIRSDASTTLYCHIYHIYLSYSSKPRIFLSLIFNLKQLINFKKGIHSWTIHSFIHSCIRNKQLTLSLYLFWQ